MSERSAESGGGSGRRKGGPEEDLAMIRRLMAESREVADAGGPFYLLWGVVVLAALLATYLAQEGVLGLSPGWIWTGAIGLGWVGAFLLGWRRERALPVQTAGGRLLTGIWVGGGVTMTLLGFAPAAAGMVTTSGGILGPIAFVMGGCYFATSFVHRSMALRWIAGGWWAGGLAMLVWSGATSLLLMAGLVLVLQIAPGLRLARSGGDVGAPAAT